MSPDLLQSIGSNVWAVFLIVFFFGGTIFFHELGHFLAARRRGMHVERFSIGFGPKIFAWRGRDGVEYCVSWLPLGGYVALPQVTDLGAIEGESRVDVERLPPVGFGTKILVLVAGAAFNVLFAFLLACVLWLAGRPELENVTTTRIGYVVPTVRLADGREVPSPALAGGLRVNDVIRAVDGRTVSDWPDIQEALVLGTGSAPDGQRVARLTIERGAAVLDVIVHPLRLGEEQMRRIGISPAHEVIVDKVDPGSPAGTWGLRAGDRFQSLDGIPVTGIDALSEYLAQHPRKSFTLVVLRDGRSMPLVAPDRASASANVFSGVEFTTNYRLLYQNPYSICSQIMATTFRTLWSLILPRGDVRLANFSGPIGIGLGFWHAAQSDYPVRFAIWFAVLLNLNLAILNLLPIPVLDGGHILFATVARLRSRALPANFIATAQGVFMVLLLSLMLYVSYFDVRRIVRDARAARPETQEPATPASPPAAP